MNLTRNFTFEELCHSDTAVQRGIDNTPGDVKVVENMTNLCIEVLQPLRDHIGRAVKVNSGYRCQELNKVVGGAPNSQHMKGEAADLSISSADEGRQWAAWIEDNCRFDQMLLERKGEAVWLHVSCRQDYRRNRQTFKVMR